MTFRQPLNSSTTESGIRSDRERGDRLPLGLSVLLDSQKHRALPFVITEREDAYGRAVQRCMNRHLKRRHIGYFGNHAFSSIERLTKRDHGSERRDVEHSTSGDLDEGLKRARGDYRGRLTDSGKRGAEAQYTRCRTTASTAADD